jgi:hypothetical protein
LVRPPEFNKFCDCSADFIAAAGRIEPRKKKGDQFRSSSFYIVVVVSVTCQLVFPSIRFSLTTEVGGALQILFGVFICSDFNLKTKAE